MKKQYGVLIIYDDVDDGGSRIDNDDGEKSAALPAVLRSI